jgi:succinate dehydrogenase / fumarate reductase, cytochrome b subunit
MALFGYLKSTILSKWVMAVTGVILVLFIIGHTLGNMQVFMGPEPYNKYAAFLQGLGELLWLVRIALLLCLVLHIITSIRLKLLNYSAKPQAYQYKSYLKAKLTSRTMIWTGLMVFAFLTFHILHFTAGVTDPENYNYEESYINTNVKLGVSNPAFPADVTVNEKGYKIADEAGIINQRHDVYKMVVKGFQQPLMAIIYIFGVILLGFHLSHAMQSALQTMGFNHPKYFSKVVTCCNLISIVITLCMISIPLTILAGLVGGTL